MLIKICAVLLSGPRGEEGPPFIGASRSLSEKSFEGAFQCNLCCNNLSVRTIMNFLNLCDSFSFMISKVLEFIHSLILNYLTYFENVSLYNEAMKSACIYSYCFDKLANFFSLSNFTQTLISYDLAKFVSFTEIFFYYFSSNTLQLFALENLLCASQGLGSMSLYFKN